MKLIYAIVHDEDGNDVMGELNKHGFSVTKLASTGGFLRAGNTTLIVGTEEEKVDTVIKLIENECKSRKQVVYTPVSTMTMSSCASVPVAVDVGGATIFVMDVERFEKI